MYDFFYWTYVVRGVSCRAVSVCTIFLYRVVLLRGSFRIVVPSLAMGYGGSLAGNTKMRKAILIRAIVKNYAILIPKIIQITIVKSGGVF